MKKTTQHCLLAATALVLAACETTTPALDAQFGDSVTSARAQQTLEPSASLNRTPPDGLDGRAARSTVNRYHESFRNPPSSFEAGNIGGSFNSGSSGQ